MTMAEGKVNVFHVWHTIISMLPEISNENLLTFLKDHSISKDITSRAYKFHVEDFIHDFEASSDNNVFAIRCKCFRSMRKHLAPHSVFMEIDEMGIPVKWSCSCVAGQGLCHHVLGMVYRLEHYQKLNLKVVPPVVSKTSRMQNWHVPPRTDGLSSQRTQDVTLQRPSKGTKSHGLNSTLYNPVVESLSTLNLPLKLCSFFETFSPNERPQFSQLWNTTHQLQLVKTNFGDVPRGSLLSYQQCYNNEETPDIPHFSFPELYYFEKYFPLDKEKFIKFTSLSLTLEQSKEFEKDTRQQSQSKKWFALRKGRLTASNFKRICSRTDNFVQLSEQLKSNKIVQTSAMKYGLLNEPVAAQCYSSLYNLPTYPVGFVINPSCSIVGCTPDRRVFDASEGEPWGLLEIKCVTCDTLEKCDFLYITAEEVPFRQFGIKTNHAYYHQIMAQMGITGSNWCDLFVKTTDEEIFHCERIYFNKEFFHTMMVKVVDFFFSYYL